MGKVNVLVVEDEAIVSMDLRNKLESFGYSVSAVIRSGEEAVAAASRLRPDVVLMDIWLSGSMDGIEAAGEIRRRFDIPVVCVTGHVDEYTLKQASSTDFRYIIKPYDDEVLRLALEMAIQWHGP